MRLWKLVMGFFILLLTVSQLASAVNGSCEVDVFIEQAQECMEREQWEEAIPILSQAHALCQEIGDWDREGQILFLLGHCYQKAELLHLALNTYQQALKIYTNLGMHEQGVEALVKLGQIHRKLGYDAEALSLYEQANKICVAHGFILQQADVLVQIGRIFFSFGDYEKALNYYHDALDIYQKHGEYPLETATILLELGQLQVVLGQYGQGLDLFHKALSLADLAGAPAVAAMVRVELGKTLAHLGHYEKALEAYSQAEYIYYELKAWLELAQLYVLFAELQEVLGPYTEVERYLRKAAVCLEKALGELNQVHPVLTAPCARPLTQLTALLSLAGIYKMLNESEKEIQTYTKAVEIVEWVPWPVGQMADKVYLPLVTILIRGGEASKALLYAERRRARLLLDSLIELSLPSEELDRLPGFRSGRIDPQEVEEALAYSIQELLPNEAVIIYLVTEPGVYLWLVLPDGEGSDHHVSNALYIPYSKEVLIRDILEARLSLENLKAEATEECLVNFYKQLVAPALELLPEGVDTLVLIPSGPLWYLPFAALPMTDQPVAVDYFDLPVTRWAYLVEHYTLAYSPSLASVPFLIMPRAFEGKDFLALWPCPISSQVCFYDMKLVKQIKEFGLCLTHDESLNFLFLQEEATTSVFLTMGPSARYLVLLGPAVINPRAPWLTHITLADANVSAWEVLGLGLKGVELVVLPATQTIESRYYELSGETEPMVLPATQTLSFEWSQVNGEEVPILALAFLSAGAWTVVQTHWCSSVSALESILLYLCDSYRENGMSWAQALQRAQIELMRNEMFSHPWFWSAYMLIGRWR